MMIEEKFVDLKGYDDYLISNLGTIYCKSLNKIITGRIDEYGDIRIHLRGNGAHPQLKKLVAETFLNKPDPSYKYIVFKDGNKLNCSSDNLSWEKSFTYNKYRVIERLKEKYGNKFDYSKVRSCTNEYDKIILGCPIHGWIEVSIKIALKSGCPICRNDNKRQEYLDKIHNLINIENIKSIQDFELYFQKKELCEIDILKISLYKELYNNEFKTAEDFQEFIDKEDIPNAKDFKNKFPGLYDKASKTKILSSLHFKNVLWERRGLKELTKEEILKIIKDNNIETIVEFGAFDSSLCAITRRRMDLSEDLGLLKSKSVMEIFVPKYLEKEGIIFEEQKTFDWLVNKSNLYIDIFIPEINLGIELQGSHHFINTSFGNSEDSFLLQQERDRIKYEKCKEHGISLIYYIWPETKHFKDIPKNIFEKGGYLGPVFSDFKEVLKYIKS